MKKRVIGWLMAMAMMLNAYSQEALNTDSLMNDFKYFIRLLEETHPDPYTNYGGKVDFRLKAQAAQQEISARPITTKADFQNLLTVFLAPLGDGHTYVSGSDVDADDSAIRRFSRIYFRVISDGLIVSEIPTAQASLLGCKLLRVNGHSVADLMEQIARLESGENLYDQYLYVVDYVVNEHLMKQLYASEEGEHVTYELLSPQGETIRLSLPWLTSDAYLQTEISTLPSADLLPDGYLSYRFLDEQKHVMLFRSTSILARDNLEYMKQNGWDYARQLRYLYTSCLHQEQPEDDEEAIGRLPSFAEIFGNMLQEMKAVQAPYLIIDLRGNNGGWTPITLPTLYQLYGDHYLKTDMQTKEVRLLSPLYLKKINQTLEAFNQEYHGHYEMGDYVPLEEVEDVPAELSDAVREEMIANFMCSDKTPLRAQYGLPVYTPQRVFVLTDAETFSAAFHYAFYLWKMGAVVVGVPCRQAPNTFMEQTPFVLPYTYLEGSISNSMQLFLPASDNRTKVFWPDLMPAYEDYLKSNFDEQTEVLFLLDKLK